MRKQLTVGLSLILSISPIYSCLETKTENVVKKICVAFLLPGPLLTDILVLVKLVVGRMEQVGTRHWKHAETDQPQTQPN